MAETFVGWLVIAIMLQGLCLLLLAIVLPIAEIFS
jgi:hypothetical protein